MATFHDRISELYEEARDRDYRIGRKKFAELCGATRGQINGWLSRTAEPDLETLKRVAMSQQVSVSWLIGETNIRNKEECRYFERVKLLPTRAIVELKLFLDYLYHKYL